MDPILPDLPRKGRGAVSNRSGRYDSSDRQRIDDGWHRDNEDEPSLQTTVTADAARSVLTRNNSPDIGFDRSINPYRGCEHGCVYCFARPSHSWLGLSAGLDFETRLFAKHDAAALLTREFARPGYRCDVVALGANTDPYQPIERKLQITRQVLQVLLDWRHPVTIITKGTAILRDLDLLRALAERNLVSVSVSIATLDPALARIMDPRAPTPARRMDAVRQLAAAGIPVRVLCAPMIPAINDHELERLMEATAAAGAFGASCILLRLPHELKDIVEEWLQAHFPDRAAKVLSLLRQCRDGGLYDASFGSRMTGTGAYAQQLRMRYRLAARRLGFGPGPALDTQRFRNPRSTAQGDLFARQGD